ncbi:ABC transporter permease [Cryobacterium roopkundense]|uniref:ABC transporter permease n=1 Tax=Cryobacterium roopkundense TaxID=1001240 RepID=A0A099JSI6_9MICO|nr:ABC transporter permease [Cryobacterium roopkundense]KGJ81101.1 ABC transporter permease [Cryobacterium roopkundense]MBB5641909.1 peptide/nickel transport system permease protein [Cryobacterium roopkundense]
MVSFIVRRLLVSVLILVAASFLMYMMVAYSADPLQDLRDSNSPNKVQLINARIQLLDLDVPPPLRWILWLGGVARCVIPFANSCDLGSTISNALVVDILPQALASTVQLVTLALVLAIVLGVMIGIVTALRQYSGLDNTVTFISFFLYSLPAFLVAVLLKEFVAIGFNDFLRDPVISGVALAVIGIIVGVILQSLLGGDRRRRLIVFGLSGGMTVGILLVMLATNWFHDPGLGPVTVTVLIAAIALGTTSLAAGLHNRRALLTAGINGALAIIAYFVLQPLFDVSSAGTLLILALATIAVGLISGFLVGGYDRGQNMRVGVITAVLSGGVVLLDRFMQSWGALAAATNGRPIATVGSSTPGLSGDVWLTGLDTYTHLALPTIALLLISFAGYTRYSRAGMLEVLSLDYVRTARAKGIPERTVIMRHAFRNMLIPITTLIAFDVGALLGGAIITETVFAIPGMGYLFNAGLRRGDVNPVMGYFVVIAAMAILFNFLADLAYAGLDPRVRIR